MEYVQAPLQGTMVPATAWSMWLAPANNEKQITALHRSSDRRRFMLAPSRFDGRQPDAAVYQYCVWSIKYGTRVSRPRVAPESSRATPRRATRQRPAPAQGADRLSSPP